MIAFRRLVPQSSVDNADNAGAVSYTHLKQEKPSIRDQLKAAAKTQPEKKSPVKFKTHDMEL